jgi:hypothetical protein
VKFLALHPSPSLPSRTSIPLFASLHNGEDDAYLAGWSEGQGEKVNDYPFLEHTFSVGIFLRGQKVVGREVRKNLKLWTRMKCVNRCTVYLWY